MARQVALLLLPLTCVLPSTHWVVTETGKVAAQPDSVFFIRQPHDLVAFLHQGCAATLLV